jgi:hypothetical protein
MRIAAKPPNLRRIIPYPTAFLIDFQRGQIVAKMRDTSSIVNGALQFCFVRDSTTHPQHLAQVLGPAIFFC